FSQFLSLCQCRAATPVLPSFPTRRSSDLTEVCDCPPRQYETCPVCRSVTAVTPSAEVDRLRTELRDLRVALREAVGWDDGVGTDIELVDAVNDWRTSALLLADAMEELGEEVRRLRSVNAEQVADNGERSEEHTS